MNTRPGNAKRPLSDGARKVLELSEAMLPDAQFFEQIGPLRGYVREALSALDDDIKQSDAEIKVKRQKIEALEGIKDWMSGSIPPRLEPNEHSRVHRLIEALRSDDRKAGHAFSQENIRLVEKGEVFVVRHDWAAALGPAINESKPEEMKLPYSVCIFEFVISGRFVIVVAVQRDSEVQGCPFVELDRGLWYCGEPNNCAVGGPFHYAWQQIVAICIALDAEVATRSVVRAPTALNRKRERNGRPPLKDFHLVDLSRRHRVLGQGTGTHRSPRLHFRRGHWRHFADHKTWINWMVVGNPELGFVDKQYRL